MNPTVVAADRSGMAHREALEARLGLRVRARLEASAGELPHDITERLRVARELAVSRARQRQAARVETKTVTYGSATVNADGTLSARGFGGPADDAWWVRLSAVIPLLLLVAGLLLIQHWERQEQIAVAADIDAALLGDALPPEAYTDPGFDEFLKDATPPVQP